MPTSPQFIQIHHSDATQIKTELLEGLATHPASISPKYLYDELGSKIFEAITCIPEYYPTRTEALIFRDQAQAMGQLLPKHAALIDLGAGNCQKAARLFNVFKPSRYIALDISVEFLRDSLECLQRQFPAMNMAGVGLDFSSTLNLPSELGLSADVSRVFFYPGSSIGNFTPKDALHFLKQTHAACMQGPGGGLLIGVDLVKDTPTLQAAYDDELGITAAFNRNMLSHLNRLAGTNFQLKDWKHIGLYNESESRIEMHLEALRELTVQWGTHPSEQRHFKAGERMHTENSYKWTLDGFDALLKNAGFHATHAFTDAHQQFAVFWAKA